MRCRLVWFVLVFSISFLLSHTVFAQSKQDALRALKDLQSRCESGVNYDGYASALNDAQAKVKEFIDSRESEKNPGFTEKIERALIAYQTAFVIWKFKQTNRQDVVSWDHATIGMLVEVYPDALDAFEMDGIAPVTKLVSFFWDKADERIAEASRMISGGKGRR